MANTDAAPRPESAWRARRWQSALLGVVLIVAGLLVLRNATAVTVVSAIVGLALLCSGLAEIAQAFGSPHWSGVIWRLLVGVLYAIGGGTLIADPLAASSVLTLAFAAVLMASGAVRLFLAVQHWQRPGWLPFASGITSILAGLVIPAQMAPQRLVGPRPGCRHRSHSARPLVGRVQLDRARGAAALVRRALAVERGA
jgi:uncharacterized membrane protein HdeD (DUF308 family)